MLRILAMIACTAALGAAGGLPPEARAALDRISADSLKGHVSFLASDLLEGRDTPSLGLNIAAEYIAAQFRRAGLEPPGDDGYFETANFIKVTPNPEGFELTLERGEKAIKAPREKGAPGVALTGVDLSRAALIKTSLEDAAKLTPEEVRGKVILTSIPAFSYQDAQARRKVWEASAAFRAEMARLKPALVLTLMRRLPMGEQSRLIDASDPVAAGAPPSIALSDPELDKFYEALKPGVTDATVSCRLGASAQQPAKLRNVIGILRGSDPALKDTYVLVTAHYDHVGVRGTGEGDHIYNGANDDASGTASVIEIAAALAKMQPRPRRSVIFMTYFGEEKGLLGSRYYGRRPVAPVEKTIADVNLEQLGRTDDSEGPQVKRATLTGFDYSDVPAIFEKAGELTGITVYNSTKNSDAYFARSDNQALADIGVPAHTLLVAFSFPDYHGAGDEWGKLDYANMAQVDRMIAAGVLMLADDPAAPRWNAANPKAERYVNAWKKLHPAAAAGQE
jgi:hypothetical protein